ncbi:MAG TPA: hypothetical protein VI589_08460 [Vicinamibacteria bacterium]
MSDPGEGSGLDAYVEVIESHFRTRKGAEMTLSPRDFALARSWHQAGVPLAVVLLGIDSAFEADASASSLSFCRRRIEDLAQASSSPSPRAGGPATGTERLHPGEVIEVLTLLEERLRAVAPRSRGAFELALRRLQEVRDLVTVASRPNWDYVRSKLREIDESVNAAAVAALPAEEQSALREEATRAGERHRGRVDAASLAEAVNRFAVQRAREKLGLPRVNLG